MKINSMNFEGKNYEQAILKAEDHFDLSEEEMIIEITQEEPVTIIKVFPIAYVSVYAEEFVKRVVESIGVNNISINSSYKNGIVLVDVDSDNNGVLIGKNGKTLNSIVHLTTQAVRTQANQYIKVNVNVGNYKDIRIKQLESIAKSISRTVAKTSVEAKLEPMNSFERRIIHEYLANDKYVVTSSEGEEPKRYVVIKLK